MVLTKTDGDARGGAALSVREVTGKPIKFLGSGEKTDALEPFHPERVASRILGMGDVLSLVEEVQRKVDHEEAARLTRKLRKGRGFDLEDFRSQLEQMNNMGGLGSMMDKLPGMANMPGQRAFTGERPPDGPDDCHHQFHDSAGAAISGHHSRVEKEADRQWLGHPDPDGQSTAQATRPDAENDEKDGQGRNEKDDAPPWSATGSDAAGRWQAVLIADGRFIAP